MNDRSTEADRQLNATSTGTDISTGRNEAGARGGDSMDHLYGRRIEADQSWTVYHVFTGIPAQADGKLLTGLSEEQATSGMLCLNRRNIKRRAARVSPSAVAPVSAYAAGCSL